MASLSIYDISHYLTVDPVTGYADFLMSEFLVNLKELPTAKFINVSNEFLDAVSHKEYGTEQLWWVLAYYNDIIDPMNPGVVVVRIPDLYDIENLMLRYRS